MILRVIDPDRELLADRVPGFKRWGFLVAGRQNIDLDLGL
jgi:hypothetical protein